MSFLKDSTLLRHQSYIHGEWVGAQSGKTFPVFNPANNEILAEVADCSAVETESAIAAADAALADWRAKTATVRAGILRRWHDLILANAEDLGLLMTLEQPPCALHASGAPTVS